MPLIDWSQRVEQIRDDVEPIASELPSHLKKRDLSQAQAKSVYDTLDRLSERTSILLDEMDDAEAASGTIEATEVLQEQIEGLRETLSGSRYRSKSPRWSA